MRIKFIQIYRKVLYDLSWDLKTIKMDIWMSTLKNRDLEKYIGSDFYCCEVHNLIVITNWY